MTDVDWDEADYCECYADESPLWYRVSHQTARKQYKCEECSGPIYPGEEYRKVTLMMYRDSGIDTIRTCHLCLELESWATVSVPCFCSMAGELHDRVQSMVKDIAPRVPGFFYEYGRRMIKIRQRKQHLGSTQNGHG